MADRAEENINTSTTEDDLEATLQNVAMPIEDDSDEQLELEIDDAPQEYTESYGTGVQGKPGYAQGGRTMRQRERESFAMDRDINAGDIDMNAEQASVVGDETVGGTVSTPDQDIVDEIGAAVGIDPADGEVVHVNETMELRDNRRWELDPKSSEDYSVRRQEENPFER